jgi:hypothetical protein
MGKILHLVWASQGALFLDADGMNGSLQLSEYPGDIVRLSCEKCGRSGQYRKRKLIERYGADMRLLDLREEIAKCSRRGQTHDACMVRYIDLVPRQIAPPLTCRSSLLLV